MADDAWSVLISSFSGDWRELERQVPTIFGRGGLDVFSLVLGRGTLPAEVAAGLSFQRASAISDALLRMGAAAEPIPTRRVADVRYRADEVWATHCTDRFDFTEIDRMILAAPAVNARRNLAVIRKRADVAPWQCERGLNHIHADASRTEFPPRERVREEVTLAELYARTLMELYPGKRFVISHIVGDSVSFYQETDGVPTQDIAPSRRYDRVWCENCHRQQGYARRDTVDPEFAGAEWGDCLVCGQEVLVASWELLKRIGPVRQEPSKG